MKKTNYKSKKGFTLIELLVVIGILAVLAAIAIPSVAGLIDRANVSADKTNSNEMTNAMERFASEYELYCQDIASGTLDIDNLDSAQGRVYNVIGATSRTDIEFLEVDTNTDVGEYQVAIYRDTKYPANAYTAQLIIQNYTKTSSSTFEPKQSDMRYWYSPDCGVIVYAEPNADQDKENKLNNQIISGTDAKGNDLGDNTQWIDLTKNNTTTLFHNNIIPEGGKYYDASANKYYRSGDSFPTFGQNDRYYFGDYIYSCNSGSDYHDGMYWYVRLNPDVTDRTKTEYSPLLESINNLDAFLISDLFRDCTNLLYAPKLPQGTFATSCGFYNCTSLIVAPAIPPNVIIMDLTFQYCTSLKTAPNMLNAVNVTNADFFLADCTSLVSAPDMRNIKSVDLRGAFSGCTSLTKVTNFPIKITDLRMTFDNCTSLKNITLPCNHYTGYSWENCSATVSSGTRCVH